MTYILLKQLIYKSDIFFCGGVCKVLQLGYRRSYIFKNKGAISSMILSSNSNLRAAVTIIDSK